MEWFGSASSIEELKGEYLNLLKKWKNDADLMAEINAQYEDLRSALRIFCELRGECGELPDSALKLLDFGLQGVVTVSRKKVFHGHTEVLCHLEGGSCIRNLVFLLPVVESLRNDADCVIEVAGFDLPLLHQFFDPCSEIDFKLVNVHTNMIISYSRIVK